MSQTLTDLTPKKRAGFEPIDHYERLIKLRETSPDEFMLRTSKATRRALHYYEVARRRANNLQEDID
jgi:hypothetical protein